MTSSRSKAFAPDKPEVRRVSNRNDQAEREADRAADAVVHGRTVSSASLRSPGVDEARAVHRQEAGQGKKTDEDKKVEALKKTSEAILETKPVKALKKKVLNDPVVKKVTDFATSPAGLIAGGIAIGGVVTGLAVAGKELPFQAPEIPLDKITPGLSARVTATGPLNAPTFVGLAITYKEQGPKDQRPKQTETEKLRAENARRSAELASFRSGLRFAPGSKEAEEQRLTQEAINWVVSQRTRELGIPGLSGAPGLVIPLMSKKPGKKKDEPIQRAPASTTGSHVAHAAVDGAVSGSGRPLDGRIRPVMEARFGHDFSSVRIHDDTRAAATAASIDASAFTVGSDIVFGSGRFNPSSPEGVHLLAHELAHVVQQAHSQGTTLRRQSNPTPTVARPTLSVDPGMYEQSVRRALNGLSSRLVQATTLARAVLPILQSLAATPIWRDSSGYNLGGGAFQFAVPGQPGTVLNLSLVLDDMADPPESGQFTSSGTDGKITIRVRRVRELGDLTEVLYHEALHMMTWIIGTHGGAGATAGTERRAAQSLQMSRYATQISGIRRTLDQLAQSVNARRRAATRLPVASSQLDSMSLWLMEEIQVRAETEVFRQARQVDVNRGRGPAVYLATGPYGSIDRRMVDRYVFDFSRVFADADRTGISEEDRATLQTLLEQLEGLFQHHVRRRFSLSAYTSHIPRAEPRFRPSPLTPPSFLPRIAESVRGEPF